MHNSRSCLFFSTFRIAIMLVALTATAPAQVDWSYFPTREAANDLPTAFDAARGVTVMVGGPQGNSFVWTDEWDGTGWTRRTTAHTPNASRASGLAYQVGTGRTLLFGGEGTPANSELGETWEYDGIDWQQRQPTNSPSPRLDPAMAWDARRGRMVLFGGESNGTQLFDTWEWDGRDWQLQQPANAPPARVADTELCFDESTQRILMVLAERTILGARRETWSWDGSDWTLLASQTLPSGQTTRAFGLVFDSVARQPILVSDGSAELEVATWDGQSWTGTHYPSQFTFFLRCEPSFDSRRGVMVLYDGPVTKTWEFTSTGGGAGNWQLREDFNSGPTGHSYMAYDPARQSLAMVNWESGSIRLWESAGGGWQLRNEQRGVYPPEPNGPMRSLVFDESAQQMTLFTHAGFGAPTPLELEVWAWDGTTWIRKIPNSQRSPSPRKSFAIASDGQRIMLFGGYSGSTWLQDTWFWDGAGWTQTVPNHNPTPVGRAALAFDERRQVFTLFGGETLGGSTNGTWEWDGSDWQQRQPSQSPAARRLHVTEFDPVRGRVMMFAGLVAGGVARDLWEWDGVDWSQLPVGPPAPSPRSYPAAAFDRDRGEFRIFGGASGGRLVSDTWILRTRDPAMVDAFGTGCPGGRGVPTLDSAPFGRPWLGDSFELEMNHLSNNASAAVVFGYSDTTWSGGMLPFDLGSIRATGCTLWVEPLVVSGAPIQNNRATLSVPVPADRALIGGQVLSQGLILDPAAPNPLRLATTHAVRAILGSR